MFGRTHNTDEGFRALKKTYRYAALQLRLDLADLVIRKLRETGEQKQDLATRAKMWPSEVSRVIGADHNFTATLAAKVLHPLGIMPKLVDAAEWNAMKEATDAARASKPAQEARRTGSDDNASTQGRPNAGAIKAQGTVNFGTFTISISASGTDQTVALGPPRLASVLGGSRPILRYQRQANDADGGDDSLVFSGTTCGGDPRYADRK